MPPLAQCHTESTTVAIFAPRLGRTPAGIYYFRLKSGGTDRRISLRTRCAHTANIVALQLNLNIERARAMSNPKISDFNFDPASLRNYEITLKGGKTIKTDGTEADHLRAMQMLEAIERIGPIDVEDQPPRQQAPAATSPPSLKLADAAKLWLEECGGKNAPRTVAAKGYHVANFIKLMPARACVNDITRAQIVEYKQALIKEKQTPKTIDNKLMSLFDFFKYLSAHSMHSGAENPVAGLFMLSKTERKKKNQPYDLFTDGELARFFEPVSYAAAMTSPDTHWGPLIGLFTGMRISEATAIKADDVKSVAGVHYIHIPQSKTSAGIRNVPICESLLALGFLDYVDEVRAAGAPRLFPHRGLVNESYAKELSVAMLARRRALNIEDPNDRKSFHSFRVGVATMLANMGANTMQAMRILGHAASDGVSTHAGYVRDLPDLKAIADLVRHPIDLASLKYAGQFGAFIANRANWAEVKAEAKAADLARRRANRARLTAKPKA